MFKNAHIICVEGERNLVDDIYSGGILLAGPEQKIHGLQTTFGIIRMRLEGDGTREITIKEAVDIKYFQDSKRDSICKQLGFTKAVVDSAYTVQTLQPNYTFEYTD